MNVVIRMASRDVGEEVRSDVISEYHRQELIRPSQQQVSRHLLFAEERAPSNSSGLRQQLISSRSSSANLRRPGGYRINNRVRPSTADIERAVIVLEDISESEDEPSQPTRVLPPRSARSRSARSAAVAAPDQDEWLRSEQMLQILQNLQQSPHCLEDKIQLQYAICYNCLYLK